MSTDDSGRREPLPSTSAVGGPRPKTEMSRHSSRSSLRPAEDADSSRISSPSPGPYRGTQDVQEHPPIGPPPSRPLPAINFNMRTRSDPLMSEERIYQRTFSNPSNLYQAALDHVGYVGHRYGVNPAASSLRQNSDEASRSSSPTLGPPHPGASSHHPSQPTQGPLTSGPSLPPSTTNAPEDSEPEHSPPPWTPSSSTYSAGHQRQRSGA